MYPNCVQSFLQQSKFCIVTLNQIVFETCTNRLFAAVQIINIDDIIVDVVSREFSKFSIIGQSNATLENCKHKIFVMIVYLDVGLFFSLGKPQ